jgi:hypothetical protein
MPGQDKIFVGGVWKTNGGGGGGGSSTDEKAKVSANDTTAGYLNGKLVAGANITLTEGTDGGNETLSVASTATSFTTNSKASMSADQTITDKTWTKVSFNTDIIDTDNELDNANKTWVCTTTGTYIISGVISWIADATGLRAIGISENGSEPTVTSYISTVNNAGALATTRTFIFGTISCTAAQAISIWGYHSKGSNLNIDADGSYFSIFRIA